MSRLALTLAAAVLTATIVPPLAVAQTATADPACAQMLDAVRVPSDPNAVVLHLHAAKPVLAGTVRAYSAARVWTGTIVTAARSTTAEAIDDQSVELRAPAPILGVELAPAWATCTLRAAVRLPTLRDRAASASPAIALNDGGAVEPLTCARPYVAATAVHIAPLATSVMAQQQGLAGNVTLLVQLDANGAVHDAAVVRSASALLNAPALDAARRSTFAAPVFRCVAVPGTYEFVAGSSSR